MKSTNYSSRIQIILLVTLIFCSGIVFSQTQPINQVDASGRKQGVWKKYDGTLLISKGTYKDGLPEGEFTYYYENNIVKAVSVFSEKAQKVFTISYYHSGGKMSEGNYINKQKDGEWKYYFENKVLMSVEHYVKGSKEGDLTSYYLKGSVNLEAHYLNNKKTGIWNSYFPDGPLKSSITYQNNLPEGKTEFYFPSKKIMISGSYTKGLQEGKWLYYDESGQVIRTEIYITGKLMSRNGTVPMVNDTIVLPEHPLF